MTKRNNYNYQYPVDDQKIIKKLSDPKYAEGNITLPANADLTEKMKYSFCQSILTYHQESKKSLSIMVKEINISSLTETTLYDICRGKINDFSLGELVMYASNLRIKFVPCLDCGRNIFPLLLEAVILSLREQENLLIKTPNTYQVSRKHQVLIHCHA